MNKVFLKKGKIEISDSIAAFGDTSYPIRNIGAVTIESDSNGSWAAFIVFAITGFITQKLGYFFGGLIFWGIAVFAVIGKFRTTHHVTLRTSSGNTHAFSSEDKAEVEEVRLAIVNAIASK